MGESTIERIVRESTRKSETYLVWRHLGKKYVASFSFVAPPRILGSDVKSLKVEKLRQIWRLYALSISIERHEVQVNEAREEGKVDGKCVARKS